MPLPKIDLPIFELKLVSLPKPIKFRPFLVKEEKLLLMALQSGEEDTVFKTIKQIINNCLVEELDIDKLPIFDIEYLFLNIRGKSVGETVDILITCPDDNKTQVPLSINLDDIKIITDKKHSRDIKLDNNLTLRMKYPSLKEFIKTNFTNDFNISVDETFDLIIACIEQVYSEEESWSSSDCTEKEISDFLEQLTSAQFKQIEQFFKTMPKLSHKIKIKNPNTGVESEVLLEGLSSFFG